MNQNSVMLSVTKKLRLFKLLSFATLTVLCCLCEAKAVESRFKAFDQSWPTRLCVLVAQGNNVVLFAKTRALGVSLAFVRAKIKCNGMSIGAFAAKYDNKRVRFLLPPTGSVSIGEIVNTEQNQQ